MSSVEYKNKKIDFEESSNPKLSIDEKPIQVCHDADARKFNTGELPYHTFNSVEELAKEIVVQRLQQEGEK